MSKVLILCNAKTPKGLLFFRQESNIGIVLSIKKKKRQQLKEYNQFVQLIPS